MRVHFKTREVKTAGAPPEPKRPCCSLHGLYHSADVLFRGDAQPGHSLTDLFAVHFFRKSFFLQVFFHFFRRESVQVLRAHVGDRGQESAQLVHCEKALGYSGVPRHAGINRVAQDRLNDLFRVSPFS